MQVMSLAAEPAAQPHPMQLGPVGPLNSSVHPQDTVPTFGADWALPAQQPADPLLALQHPAGLYNMFSPPGAGAGHWAGGDT